MCVREEGWEDEGGEGGGGFDVGSIWDEWIMLFTRMFCHDIVLHLY